MQQMTGKQLETHFGIRQQYRSRYDKAYRNFISPSDVKPRLYDESDIAAYDIILKSLELGQSRPSIITKLVAAAKEGNVSFYPSDAMPELPDAEEPATTKAEAKPKREHTRKPKMAHTDLIEKVATLNAQVEIYNEQLGDCFAELDEVKKQNVALNLRLAILENALKQQGILIPVNQPVNRPEEGTPKGNPFRAIAALFL